jgi:hypothetical protein
MDEDYLHYKIKWKANTEGKAFNKKDASQIATVKQ